MPVTIESTEGKTRRGRGWLLLPACLLAALLLAVLVTPFFQPVKLQAGGVVVVVRGIRDADHPLLPGLPQGISIHDQVAPGRIRDMDGGAYAASGGFHRRAVRVGTWAYYVAWFKGRRVR